MEGDLKSYLLQNFTRMPKDVALLILNKLSTKDVLSLCSVNQDLHEFCTKYNVLVQQAKAYISKKAPLSEPLDDVFKQANAIKRGQSTYYSLGLTRQDSIFWPQTFMGDIPSGMNFTIRKYFTIRGSPPPTGTKIFLLGVQSSADYDVDRNPRCVAYQSIKDIKEDEGDPQELKSAIEEGFLEQTYEEAIDLLANRFMYQLGGGEIDETDLLYRNWFIYEVELP